MAEKGAARIAGLASALDEAQRNARPIAQFSTEKKPVALADAYAIQAAASARHLRRGERRRGAKLGFTSRAKAAQMGVFDVICGRLTDAILLPDGGMVDLARFIHPRVDPEVAFLLAKPLRYPISPAEAWAAVGGVAPELEIIDSRYENFKFSLADVVADDCSGPATCSASGMRRRWTSRTSAWCWSSTAAPSRSARRRLSSAIRRALWSRPRVSPPRLAAVWKPASSSWPAATRRPRR